MGKLDSMKREDPELRDLELQMMVLMGDLERIEERKRKLMLCRKYLVEVRFSAGRRSYQTGALKLQRFSIG